MAKTKPAKTVSGTNKLSEQPWFPWVLAAGILLLTFISMSPVLENEWTNWDDEIYVLNNTTIRSLEGEAIGEMFKPENRPLANFDPVSMLTLAWDYDHSVRMDASGLPEIQPKAFHRTNLIFHLFNTLLVFVWLYYFTGKKLLIPGLVALFFGIHPMHVEAVAWVSARKEVVYTFFFLLSLIAWSRHLQKNSWILVGLSFLAFVLSALSKPTALVLPLVLFLMDWYQGRKWEWKLLLEKLPFFALALWVGFLTVEGQANESAIASVEKVGLLERFFFVPYGLMMYIVKSVVPFDLSGVYPYPRSLNLLFYIAPVFFLACLAGLYWLFRKGEKGLVFGGMFFLITVALVSQVIAFGHSIMAERFTYLPYVGLFFMYGFAMEKGLQKWEKSGLLKWAGPGLAVVLALIFVPLTQDHAKSWKNSKTLWDRVISVYPETASIAYNGRGLYYKDKGFLQEALKDCNAAIGIDAGKAIYFANRGNIYRELADQGQNPTEFLKLSVKDLSESISLDPDNADAWNSRGLSYLDQGREKEALSDFNKAIELDKSSDLAYVNRAVLYLNDHKLEEALDDFDHYLEMNPNDHQIVNLRGYTRFRLGKFESALQDQNRAVAAMPDNGSLYMFRAMTLDTLGRTEEAWRDAQKAMELGTQVDPLFLGRMEARLNPPSN